MFKRTLVSTIIYLWVGLVAAGTLGEINTGKREWGFGAQALYLQANFSSLGYIGSYKKSTINSYHETFQSKDFNYGFGFKLETFYKFKPHSELNLNWYHYDHTSTQSLNSGINVYDGFFSGVVTLKLYPKWDAVNLELAQSLALDHFGKVRFHGGLQYADIKQNNLTTATHIMVGNAKMRTNYSSYRGVGPRIGGDIVFDAIAVPQMQLYANLATGILVGSHTFDRLLVTYTTDDLFFDGNSGSCRSIVSVFQVALGASYQYVIADGNLNMDAGWMIVDYFNPIEIADSFHNGRSKESNFALQGPYLGLKWVGTFI